MRTHFIVFCVSRICVQADACMGDDADNLYVQPERNKLQGRL